MSAAPTYDTLELSLRDAVATLTLNRPAELNTMNIAMREELGDCLDWVRAQSAIRVLVITGAGKAFSAGGDLNDFTEVGAEDLHDLMRSKSHRWFQALWTLPQPTIAAVNGAAAGGGANLMLAADMAIASEEAQFGETFVRVGLMPDLGGLFLLPRLVGLRRAKELCFTGALLSATEAHDLGLVNKVVPHEDLMSEVAALAARLADQPAKTLSTTKAVMNRSFELSMEQVLLYELLGQSFLFGTDDHRDRLEAFLTRRAPAIGM